LIDIPQQLVRDGRFGGRAPEAAPLPARWGAAAQASVYVLCPALLALAVIGVVVRNRRLTGGRTPPAASLVSSRGSGLQA
jgi:hypothetical protein